MEERGSERREGRREMEIWSEEIGREKGSEDRRREGGIDGGRGGETSCKNVIEGSHCLNKFENHCIRLRGLCTSPSVVFCFVYSAHLRCLLYFSLLLQCLYFCLSFTSSVLPLFTFSTLAELIHRLLSSTSGYLGALHCLFMLYRFS